MNSQETGRLGEDIAVKYLKKKKYKILDKNFEIRIGGIKAGEMDIVAKKYDTICFIEVKTLKKASRNQASGGFFAEDKVDFKKKKNLIKTAEVWLSKHKVPFDSKWQIDVIAVNINSQTRKAKISHFQNAIGL